jgi:hypothetical protein
MPAVGELVRCTDGLWMTRVFAAALRVTSPGVRAECLRPDSPFSSRRPRYSAVPNSVGAVSRAASDNPLGLGLIIVGAVAMAISAFLPLVEPINAFRMVEDNTLIQHGGWWLIAAALGIAASGYRVSRGGSTARWAPVVLCVIAAALVVFNANDKDMRTLYPVGPDGNPITTQPGVVANLGIAIYVAGAGVAAAFIGSVMLGRREDEAEARVAPTPERNGRLHERASQAKPHTGQQRTRPELEAELEAAEAEAQAAEARARAIRLRREAEANAKPAPSPQSSKPPSGQQNPKPGSESTA